MVYEDYDYIYIYIYIYIISLVRVWLILSLNFVLLYLIVDLLHFQCPMYSHLYFISYSSGAPFCFPNNGY